MTITYEFEDYGYEYEIDGKELIEYISELFAKNNGISKESAQKIIENYEDCLLEALENEFEDEITEYFEKEAREQFYDDKAYNDDKYSYYGISKKDFN